MKPSVALLAYSVVALVAFAVGYSDTSIKKIGTAVQRMHEAWVFESRYEPRVQAFANGEEIVMIYVGRRHCAPSNARGLAQQVEDIKGSLYAAAVDQGASFRAIGMATDARIDDGLAHLKRFGEFDEVWAGGGGVSDAAMKYLWQDFPGEVATPQIILLRRIRVSPSDSRSPMRYRLEGAIEIERLVGLDQIGTWLAGDSVRHVAYFAPDL